MIKLFKFLPIALFGICLVFNSCSEDGSLGQKSNAAHLALLQEYNRTYTANRPVQKGFWDGLGRVAAIAGADIIGAAAGVASTSKLAAAAAVATGGWGGIAVSAASGVICGGGASYFTHNQMKSFGSQDLGSVMYTPTIFNNMDIGQYHNDMLEFHYFGETSERDVIHLYYDAEVVDRYLFNNEDFVGVSNSINNCFINYSNLSDADASINQLVNLELLSVPTAQVLKEFIFVLQQTENFDDVTSHLAYYDEVVAQSKLSDGDKKSIIASLSTARSSLNYWNAYYNN